MRSTRTFARFTTAFNIASLDPPSAVVLRSAPFGPPIALASNTPLVLDDPESLWVVASGEVDLFYMRAGSAAQTGSRRYVGTLWAGEVIAGTRSRAEPDSTLVAVGFGGAAVYRVPRTALDDASTDGSRIARALAGGLAETIGRAMHRASRAPSQPLEMSFEPLDLAAGASITTDAEVMWLIANKGTLAFGGDIPLIQEPTPLPLARGMWFTVTSPGATVTVVDTLAMLDGEAIDAALARAWELFLAWIAHGADAEDTVDRGRLRRKIDGERERYARALASLSGLLESHGSAGGHAGRGDELFDACVAVGSAARLTFRAPPVIPDSARTAGERARRRDRVAEICSASRVRRRRVALRGDWWKLDAGPLLAFSADTNAPVALLSSALGGYTMLDPATNRRTTVTEHVAAGLEPFAYTFYRPTPAGSIKLRALAQMVIGDIAPDLRRVFALVVAGSLLGLAFPIATRKMFNDVIPSADMSNALMLVAALVSVAIGASAFDVSRALALVRVEGRSNAVLQAAIVDRLLSLPAQFFRQFTVGDLSLRADAVNAARQMLTGVAITSILGGALAVTSFVLMVSLSARLAAVALVVLVIGAVVTSVVSIALLPYERRRQALDGEISSLVFEMLGGIAKLRVAAAESRMFAIWGAKFREVKLVAYRAGLRSVGLTLFNDALPVLASTALFMVAIKVFAGSGDLTTGDFIAFYAAFGVALSAGTNVSNTLVSILAIGPLLERATPILAAIPEVDDAKPDVGPISGRIELSHVTFGYVPGAPPIVDDVSLQIRPGEYVACVGPSGAGKSTILRLLLGFEKPDRGAVYYDGHDLAAIDVTAIRRQCAVVLQQSRLLAGDIFTNIVGASPLSLDDAWRAAELAGIADDIRDMPMGMHTVISEDGSTLSGGQRQRLLIARALVRNPRVVIFDEATSALDNRTQEVVTRSLEGMQATRIVIAHRLTTVQRADRIFVLTGGRIVQQGRYEELISAEGLFKQLAARQLV